MLIQQLRELEADGIVVRHDYQEVPPRVDCAKTDYGTILAVALVPLCQWGNAYCVAVAARRVNGTSIIQNAAA